MQQRGKPQGTATKLRLQRSCKRSVPRAGLAGAKETSVQSPWSPGSRGRPVVEWLPWKCCLTSCTCLALLPAPTCLLEGVTKVERRLMEQKAELTSMCLSAAAPEVWSQRGRSPGAEPLLCGGSAWRGGEKSQGLQVLSCLCWVSSSFLCWGGGEHQPLWGLSLGWYKAGRETRRLYCCF